MSTSIKYLWVLVLLTYALAGCANPRWKEEVVLFDGSTIVVERTRILGHLLDQEFSDVSLGRPTVGNALRVPVGERGLSIEWEAIGLNPLALGRKGTAYYLATRPMLCGDYDKWGRPVPPYVFFKYQGDQWTRIPLDEFPPEVSALNLLVSGHSDAERETRGGYVSAEKARFLNHGLPDYVKNVYRTGSAGFERCRQRLEAAEKYRKEKIGK